MTLALPAHIRPYADSATFMTGNGPRRGRERVGEWFSLTWERTASGWRILHDHSG